MAGKAPLPLERGNHSHTLWTCLTPPVSDHGARMQFCCWTLYDLHCVDSGVSDKYQGLLSVAELA